jgi:hypothetical protein
MVDQATATYLNDNIGAVLAKALSEMAVQQPNDGVDFIAQWLKTYAEQEEMKTIRQKEEVQLKEDRVITQKKEEEKAKRSEVKLAEKTAIQDAYDKLLGLFNDPETMFTDSYWQVLVDVAKQQMGAQSVYLGLLDEEGLQGEEGPLVRYSHENIVQGSPTLLDKVLPKMNGDVENLTFGALKEVKTIPEEEHEKLCLWKPPMEPLPPPGPDGAEPEAPPGPDYCPISVPCATDVPTMHYFEMPRLGAYLAVPLVYNTYYTQGAFASAKAFEEEKAEDLRKKEAAAKEKEEQIQAALDKGEPAPEFPEEEEVPEKVMELPGEKVQMVLCMDTLGANHLFQETRFVDMMALCDACAACKARTETKQVDEQALYAIAQLAQVPDDTGETELSRLRADVEKETSEATDLEMKAIAEKQPPYEPEMRKALEECVQKKSIFTKAKTVVCMYRENVNTFVGKSYTVQDEVLKIFAAIAFLIGYAKEDVFPPRKLETKWLKWWKVKMLFEGGAADTFFSKLEACDLEVGKKNLTAEQKLNFIQGLVPAEFNEEKAREVGPAFEVLWTFLSTALDYRTGELKQKQAEFEQRKKDAEAAETPFEEPDLTTVDDDFEAMLASAA